MQERTWQSYFKRNSKQPSSESIAIWRTPSHCMKEIKCSRDQVDLARHVSLKCPCIFQSASHRNSSFTSQKAFPPLHSLNQMLCLALILDSGPHGFWGKVAKLSLPSNHSSVLCRTDKNSLTTARSSSETGSPSTAASFCV
jgi:hypothetical protein